MPVPIPNSVHPEFVLRGTSAANLGVAVLVLLLALVHHAAKLPLPRELLAQVGEVTKELLAYGDEGVLGGDGAVGLDPDEDLGHIRVRHCQWLAFGEL